MMEMLAPHHEALPSNAAFNHEDGSASRRGHDRRVGTPWIIATMTAAIIPRCLWLTDMEYKSDEAATVRTLAGLAWKHWTPLAPLSKHSGIAHSSGFFYLLFGITPNKGPITIVAAIALLNTIAIVVPLWCLRRTPKYFYTFALCATSLTLILGSRKIWTPDLQAAWVCASIALVGASSAASKQRSFLLAALAAFCLVMAGHMYLPGVFVAALGSLTVFIVYAITRRWMQCSGWAIGAAAGWSTFIPWAMAMFSHVPGSRAEHGPSLTFSVDQLLAAARMGLTVQSSYDVYDRYLRPNTSWLNEQLASSLFAKSTLLWIVISCLLGCTLFTTSIIMVLRRRREVLRDPLLLTACGLLLTMPVALFMARLGTYIHYWLAVIPFFYYWIAWTVTRGAVVWRWMVVAVCVTSWLAASSFAGLVHENHGLPGEYGRSFSSRGL